MTVTSMTDDELLAYDRQHIWHPYSSFINPPPVYPVARAQGCYLELNDGRQLLDGMASWWSVIHGYNHPVLNAAVTEQLHKTAHVMFGGLTHEPAVALAKTLVEITPAGLDKVFFADSGSVAVEVALKMAIQYWQSQGHPQKVRMLALKRAYHGDTFGAMSVCDPVTGMHQLFQGALAQQLFAEAPPAGFHTPLMPESLDSMEALIAQHHASLAAVILEPIVQGAGGMRFYSPDYLRGIKQLCDKYNLLLIADEIATGFGRTGKLFACEHAAITPDILCIGKALTGGYMSLAATLCNDRVSQGICQGAAGVFMHGPTFMANPLATATALASVSLLLSSDWQQKVSTIEQGLEHGLTPCRSLPNVADVRVLGAIGVVEMNTAVDMASIQTAFIAEEIWVRPFGRLVYVMPPYVITDAEMQRLTSAMVKVLSSTK